MHAARADVSVMSSVEDADKGSVRESLLPFGLIFVLSYLVLFLTMSLRPTIYDEGLMLTGAMRVLAGQIPHRDFYAIYGPAQFYLLAGLFKVFGMSVLVERLFDLAVKATLVASVYTVLRPYCTRAVTLAACAAVVLWLFALHELSGPPIIAVALLSLVSTARMVRVIEAGTMRRSLLGMGALAGVCALFRYDVGLALLVFQASFMAIAMLGRGGGARKAIGGSLALLWPYLLGFVSLTLPALAYYLWRAPFGAFLHDIVIYPGLHYHRGRNLPFPKIRLRNLDDLLDYVTIPIVALSLYAAAQRSLRRSQPGDVESRSVKARVSAFLAGFGLLTAMLYMKGLVRICPLQLFACIPPAILLLAVLYEKREVFPRAVRMGTAALLGLFALATLGAVRRELKDMRSSHTSIPEHVLRARRGTLPGVQTSWCRERNPLTRGLCFVEDDGRLEAIEYLERHTVAGQTLFSGVPHHDTIFADDMLLYFAVPRMPATKWADFGPGLQNDRVIQAEMVRELERNVPPFVIIDGQINEAHEANDSSKSSGVTLLDDYLHSYYRQVEQFSEMAIFARQVPSSEGVRRSNAAPAAR